MLKQTDFLSILYVLILDLYKVYKSVPKVMIKRQNAWTAPTFSLFPLTNLTYEKSSLPATPPIEELFSSLVWKVWVSVGLKTAYYQGFSERYLLINFIKFESLFLK